MTRHYSLLAALLLALLPASVSAEETEITSSFIKNASFEQDFTSWTNTGLQVQSNNSFKQKDGKKYAEKWTGKGGNIGNCSVTQDIAMLPAGHYRLSAAAQNIQQDVEANQTGAVIFAGTAKTTVTAAGYYEVTFDGTGAKLQIGFKCTNATGNWVATDNFQLFFTGSDATQLAKNVTDATALAGQDMLPATKTKLQEAIDAATAVPADAAQADIDAAALSLILAIPEARQSINETKAANTALTAAKKLIDNSMAAGVKTQLLTAIEAVEAILAGVSDADLTKATTALTEASAAARNSHTAYTKLETALTTAKNVYDAEKEGADALKAAIDAAQAILDSETSTDADYTAATNAVNDAVLAFRVTNSTGKAPKVTTGAVIQGSTLLFARGTFPTSGVRERGFCFSTTNPDPTIYDGRATTKYSNNGDIYYIENLKPATVYYVRAYAISTTYAVGYGDVVKTYTRPAGNVSYDYDFAGDEATNKRIDAACEESVWMWNNVAGIDGFHLSAHYVPGAGAGDGTADCSYGGYMRISQNAAYQRTGTVLHEGSHGLGVIPYTDWTNSIYRTNGDRGDWLGQRVDRVMQFLENSSTAKLHGDNQHMWPYGINGAGEDTGAPMLYRGNALIVGALAEDGIVTPNHDFMRPAYAFEYRDDVKYYIKSADTKYGLATSYLRANAANKTVWAEMNAIDALTNDSCAWYVTFNPATCKYNIKNAATGRYLNAAGTSVTSAIALQMLPARATTKNGSHTFASLAFWILNSSHQAFLAKANGATGNTSFDHTDKATAQRWLFLDDAEVVAYAAATGDDSATGVRQPATADASNLTVSSGKGCVSISATGLPTGQTLNIYTIDGRCLQRVTVQNGATANISLPRGLYIIEGRKVMVR